MRARRAALVAATAILALAVPGVATGQAAQEILSPGSGAVLATPVGIEVRVNTNVGLFDDPHNVRVRLGDRSGNAISDPVDLNCIAGDCPRGVSRWGGETLAPATLHPFGSDAAGCNGGYTILASVDYGAWSGHAVRVAVPPSAPTGVNVDPGELEATIGWNAVSHRDLSGYQVQRRTAGGNFASAGQVDASKTTFVDSDAPEGDVEYRVVAQRPDGLVNGSPAAACADTGRDLTAASSPVATTVTAPDPTPSDSPTSDPTRPSRPSPTDPGTGPGDGGTEPTDGGSESSGGGADGDGETPGDDGSEGAAGDPDAPADDGPEGDGATTAPRTGGGTRRVSPPSALGTITAPGGDVASAEEPTVSSPRELYYGEDEGFSEEIDFGDAARTGSQEPGSTTSIEAQTVRIPGALQSVFGEELELDRLLGPVATGLLLLTISVHLRRWSRAVT